MLPEDAATVGKRGTIIGKEKPPSIESGKQGQTNIF